MEFQKLFLSPGFLVYGGILIAASLVIVFYFAPRYVRTFPPELRLTVKVRYGKKSMLWYIMVCSMIGGISVSVTTGLGAAIVTTAYGDNQVREHCRDLDSNCSLGNDPSSSSIGLFTS